MLNALFRATRVHVALLVLAPIVAAACTGTDGSRPAGPPPPPAEFLVAAGDSTFWVRATAEGVRRRGSSLLVARLDDDFHELYTADDDRSFYDAIFVGQRIYRRDLVSGDSVLVYSDSVVPALQRRWAREHPEELPLALDEEASERPIGQAMADMVLLDVHDHFLSVEHRVDVDMPGAPHLHGTVRRVVDLVDGGTAGVGAIVGRDGEGRVLRQAQALLAAARDSIGAARDPRADRARSAAGDLAFDPYSFTLTHIGGEPAISFVVPGRGVRASGTALTLPALPVTAPEWWDRVRPTLPVSSDSVKEEWRGKGYLVRARYDAGGERASVALADAEGREWLVGPMPAPLRRILWLDAPPLDSLRRNALERAFDDAVFYDDAARVASRAGRAPSAVNRPGRGRALRTVAVTRARPVRPAGRRPAATSTRAVMK